MVNESDYHYKWKSLSLRSRYAIVAVIHDRARTDWYE